MGAALRGEQPIYAPQTVRHQNAAAPFADRKAAVFLSLSVRQGLADALRGGAWLLSAHVAKQRKGCGLFFRWGCREFPLRRAAISREHPPPCAVCPFVLSAFLRCEAELREGFGLS